MLPHFEFLIKQYQHLCNQICIDKTSFKFIFYPFF